MEISQKALDAAKELEKLASRNEVREIVDYSGELLARFDRAWQDAHNNSADVNGPIADFLFMTAHHCNLLRDVGAIQQAYSTLVFSLLSVDISGADTSRFPKIYLHLLRTFVESMIEFAAHSEDDPFVSSHTDVIARYAAGLYLAAYKRLAPDDRSSAAFAGALESLPLADTVLELNGSPVDYSHTGEILVDILSRFHALGFEL